MHKNTKEGHLSAALRWCHTNEAHDKFRLLAVNLSNVAVTIAFHDLVANQFSAE